MLTDALNCYKMPYPLNLDDNRINKLQSLFGFAGVYNRFIRAIMNGSTSRAEKAFLLVMEKICSVNDCNGKAITKGYCSKHYQRITKTGKLELSRIIHYKCKISDCDNNHHSLGYCRKHYIRFKKNGNTDDPKYHMMKGKTEYNSWQSMKQRCSSKKYRFYHRYGGRGISICERWNNSFVNFYEDMGPKPFPNYHIHRVNNDGNYSPENCIWFSPRENARTDDKLKVTDIQREEIRLLYKTEKHKQYELAEKYNVSQSAISAIISNKSKSYAN